MPYAYNPQAPPVHTLHSQSRKGALGIARFNARRYPIVDPLARSSALGPLGASHWKQRAATHCRQPHREQCVKYFRNSRGDTQFIYNTTDGESVQVVLLNSSSDSTEQQQSVLINPYPRSIVQTIFT